MVLTQIYGYDELQMLQSRLPMVSGFGVVAGEIQALSLAHLTRTALTATLSGLQDARPEDFPQHHS